MKEKICSFLVIFLLAMSVVFATGSSSSGSVGSTTLSETDESGTGVDTEIKGTAQPLDSGNPDDIGNGSEITQETQNKGEDLQIKTQQQVMEQAGNNGAGEQVRTQTQNQVQSGIIAMQGGKQLEVKMQNNNQIQLKSGNSEAKTSMKMTQEQTQEGTKLQVQLSNGKNAEVKVMPDSASEKAIERLQLKSCTAEEGCSIELKEVGSGEKTKAAYEIKTQKESKVLGIFKAKMQVQAQVDAENGEIIKANKPWWAFLAAE